MKYLKKIIILLLMIVPIISVKAIDVVTIDDILCTKTDEYLEYEKLSSKEKQKVFEPVMCKETKLASQKLKSSSSEYSNMTKFDLRDVDGKKYSSSVKDQMQTGLCWAHAAGACIENNYLMNTGKELDVSELHMGYMTSYQLKDGVNPNAMWLYNTETKTVDTLDTIAGGGNYLYAGQYLVSRKGIVVESAENSALTINDTITDATQGELKLLNIKNDYNVNEIIYYSADSCIASDGDRTDLNKIKELIAKYGGVASMTRVGNFKVEDDPTIAYLNNYSSSSSFFYGSIDHGVTLVGWDDNYAKENFAKENIGGSGSLKEALTTPAGDGAWIAKNSYGTEYNYNGTTYKIGDEGYFYISYYDIYACASVMAVNDVEENNTDNSYYYYQNGNFYMLQPESDYIYLANKYQKKNVNMEELESITIFTYEAGDEYELYYSKDLNMNNAKLLAKGTATAFGYKNIKLDKIYTTDEEFYVILKYKGNAVIGAFATELSSETVKENLLVVEKNPQVGVSYYSEDAKTWQDTVNDGVQMCFKFAGICFNEEELDKANFYPLIYTHTKTYDYSISLSSVTNNLKYIQDGGNITLDFKLNNVNISDVKVSVLNSKNKDITESFEIKKENKAITIKAASNAIAVGDYKISLKYKEYEVEETFSVGNKNILVSKIELSGDNEVLANGKLVLNATVTPENATNKTLKWTSSNESVATVNNEGIVSAISEGTATITVSATDGSNVTATKEIKVVGVPKKELLDNTVNNDNSNVSGNSQTENNPQTGISPAAPILILILAISLLLYGKVKNKWFFKKI